MWTPGFIRDEPLLSLLMSATVFVCMFGWLALNRLSHPRPRLDDFPSVGGFFGSFFNFNWRYGWSLLRIWAFIAIFGASFFVAIAALRQLSMRS